jgi:hypothetical protein
MINFRELRSANRRSALPACGATVRRPTVATPVPFTSA